MLRSYRAQISKRHDRQATSYKRSRPSVLDECVVDYIPTPKVKAHIFTDVGFLICQKINSISF